MRAAESFEHFQRAFTVAAPSAELRHLKSAQPKWKAQASRGAVTFKFSTNSKTAGLLPNLWPGEFRPLVTWQYVADDRKVNADVSFFQYADAPKVQDAVRLQRVAIEKYLGNRYDSPLDRETWIKSYDPFFEPRPNIEQWFYYFDADDAAAWGKYFGSFMAPWMHQFNQRPESRDEWCSRELSRKPYGAVFSNE